MYAWQGAVVIGPASGLGATSPVIDVPAGDYVVRWQGKVNNTTGSTPDYAPCTLLLNDSGSNLPLVVPAHQWGLDSSEVLVHAGHPFTTYLRCTGSDSIYSVATAVLTATATGTLHGSTVTTLP